jgi:hypothetical protein
LNSKYDSPPTYDYIGDANGERDDAILGFADFLLYDILLLLILSLPLSMTIKILVTHGCIISVQVGYFVAIEIFEMMWEIDGIPALPLSIITFSIYILVLDTVTSLSSQCIEFF